MVSIIVPVYNQEELITKALESIPERDDLEVIIVNDCSTDKTLESINNWKRKAKVFSLETNKGNCFAKNVGIEAATGEWIYTLDSDDYLYTEEFSRVLDQLDDNYDLIYVANDENNGEVWEGTDRVAPWSYFIKRSFLGDLRYDEHRRRAGDYELMKLIKQKNPKIKVLKNLVYHYNFPRIGSIVWSFEHGLIDEEGNDNV